MHPFLIALIGLPVGFLMGLTSFAGAIIVPTLVLLMGVSQARAQGTAVAITMSPLQVPAIWNFHRAGNIDWSVMGLMVPGVIIGTFLGSKLANHLPPAVLRSVFGLTMVYAGSYFLLALTTPSTAKALLMSLVVTVLAAGVMGASTWHERSHRSAVNLN
jgi:uncharacterized protein